MIQQLVFAVLAAITLAGAVGVVASRTAFLSALCLIAALFGVAGMYILLSAGLLAMVQVLIYVGAIGVLILFTIMLTPRVMGAGRQRNRTWILALAAGLGLLAVLAWLGVRTQWPQSAAAVLPPSGGTMVVQNEAVSPTMPAQAIPASERETNEAAQTGLHIPGPVVMLGVSLMSSHLLAFELISAILLVALVGAVIIARE